MCGTNDEEANPFLNGITSTANQNVTMAFFDNQPPLVLKVHFYDVRPDQLQQQHTVLTVTEALNAVAELNKNYNSFKVFFKFDGIDNFVSDEFYTIDADEESPDVNDFDDFLFNNDYYTEGAINIYSVHFISNNIGAYFRRGGNYPNFSSIVSRYSYIDNPENPSIQSHEVGHFFNLKHTFRCREGATEGSIICENVTRDPYAVDEEGNSIYNADIEGDEIIDTYATPQNYNVTDCVYDDDKEDSTGTLYSLYPPQTKNFMSYQGVCREEFTPGQIAKIRWYIELINGLTDITTIENHPVSILYEPYKGEYFVAGSLPVDEDGHLNPPKFQYGFDYVFYDTSQANVYNQPTAWNVTNFWSGSVTQSFDVNHNSPILHPNHTAFKILQIDGNYPRMCYNNYNKAPSGGTIIKFLDNVPNTNVTITSQDSTSINNPNLINNLDPGLYNIIENYDDGGSQETLIFKENN